MKTIQQIIIIFSIFMLCSNGGACELMACSFNQEIPADSLFSAFRCRGKNNPDGWGITFYSDKAAVLFKEPFDASQSVLAEFLSEWPGLRGKLIIAHVRRASVGGRAYQNTHPFIREMNGMEYVLAHNGTLRNYHDKLKLGRTLPLGINDTEFLLCYLMGRISGANITEWNNSKFEWLKNELYVINNYGSLNCIFSDGNYLFAYHDKKGYNGLYYIMRQTPYRKVNFPDLNESVDLSKIYPATAVGVVLATRPLTDESWTRFTPGQLMVFKDGIRIFPSTDSSNGKK